MLTTSELAAMQATQAATLTETCTRVRKSLVSDGAGGQVPSETSVSSPCRLAPSRNIPADRMVAGGIAEQSLYRITLPVGFDIKATDHITIVDRTFEVMGIHGPYGWASALVCVCVER